MDQYRHSQCFLPNFCEMRMVFVVVIIAQLFAFVFILVPDISIASDAWQRLGLVSLYVQWCALSSSAVLCMLRPVLARFSNIVVSALGYALVLFVVLCVSELSYWFAYPVLQNHYSQLQFVGSSLLITAIVTGPILRYFYVQFQWRENVRAESEARLQSLQARIRPHFFFNSMNSIASLTRTDAELAEKAVENLSQLFRASLSEVTTHCPFEKELQICQAYIEIEKLRLGDRLEVDWQVDHIPASVSTLPLLVQPLIENAIYHGIELRAEGGRISVTGKIDKGLCKISVCNPRTESRGSGKGLHIAQDNIRARLLAVYGNSAGLDIEDTQNDYCVFIYWPVEQNNAS